MQRSRRWLAGLTASGAVAALSMTALAADGRRPGDPTRWHNSFHPQPDAAGAGPFTYSPKNNWLKGMLASVWDDLTASWATISALPWSTVPQPDIEFVDEIRPSHCAGLYVGPGPIYCTNRTTVIVGLDDLDRLANRLPRAARNGLAVLLAHELGHHVQHVTGRYAVLASMVRAQPQRLRELSLKFELEADCLAGVWAGHSRILADQPNGMRDLRRTLAAIGDDQLQLAAMGMISPSSYTHGSGRQRLRWFNKGADAGHPSGCNALEPDIDD
jgi:uncharacterized protein